MRTVSFVTAGEEDEEWSKNVASEEEASNKDDQSDKKTLAAQATNLTMRERDNEEVSNGGYLSEDEGARRSSPHSDAARSDSKSPDLPKVRVNTHLATDPARNTPSAKSISPSQSPTGSVRSGGSVRIGSDGKVSIKPEPIVSPSTMIPSPAELEYLASLPPALQSGELRPPIFFFLWLLR